MSDASMLLQVVGATRSSDGVAYRIAINYIRVGAIRVQDDGAVLLDQPLNALFRSQRDVDRLAGVKDIDDLHDRLAELQAEGAVRPPVEARVEFLSVGTKTVESVFIGEIGDARHGRGITLEAHEWDIVRRDLAYAGLVRWPPTAAALAVSEDRQFVLDTLSPLIGEDASRALWASIRERPHAERPTSREALRTALAAWFRKVGAERELSHTLATARELLLLLEAIEVLTWERFWWLLRCSRDEAIPAWQSAGRVDAAGQEGER